MSHSIASSLSGQVANSMPFIPRRTNERDAHTALVATATRVEKQAVSPEPAAEKPYIAETATCVVYSTDSNDSIFAAAMLLDAASRDNKMVAVGYSDEIPYNQAASYNKIILIAPGEVERKFLDRIRNEKKCLTVFTYRGLLDGIDYVEPPKKNWYGRIISTPTPWGDNLKVIRPDDDNYGQLATRISNTMIDLVQCWLEGHGKKVMSPILNQMLVPMKRSVSLSFPIVDDVKVGLNERGTSKKSEYFTKEIHFKSILFNMMPKVAAALRSFHPAHALGEIVMNNDIDNYMAAWKDNSNTLARSSMVRTHKIKNLGGIGITFDNHKTTMEDAVKFKKRRLNINVRQMVCSERRWPDLLSLAYTQNNAFISYEDMHGVRLWRVFAKNPDVAQALVASLQGAKVWSDGVCLRTYTKLDKQA